MKTQATCRCLLTWSGFENVGIQSRSSAPNIEVMLRKPVAAVENFWINQED